MNFQLYLDEIKTIADQIDQSAVKLALDHLRMCRQNFGSLFILGNGGSAANAGHAVNDFRKIAGMQAFSPSDNVAELTAWANDEGWEHTFYHYLREAQLSSDDCVMVLSVGGGSHDASPNLIEAMEFAWARSAPIISVVSRDGGWAKKRSAACILIPPLSNETITPHAESWQAIIWHYLALSLWEEAST